MDPEMRTVAAPGFGGRIGVARRDVTPPVGIAQNCWGPAVRRDSTGVHRPLTLTALALGDPALVLIALDGSWWRAPEDEWLVRSAAVEAAGGDEARVIVALSHTHAGPILARSAADVAGGELIPDYLEALRAAAAEATREAIAAAVPARLEWATGRCSVAGARDLVVDARPLVGFDPDALADDTVLAGRVGAEDGTVLATLVNYACHPTTLAWQNTLTSPDYAGAMRETVEAATGGAPCLFLLGAAGELAPREQYTGDLAVADRHGRALGHAALAALESLPPAGTALALHDAVESGAPLAPWWPVPRALPVAVGAEIAEVDLELADVPTADELAQRWSGIDAASRNERLRRAAERRRAFGDGPALRHRIWLWRLGDAFVVGQGGEAYSAMQRELRARHPGRAVVVLNLANWPASFYLPPASLYARDDGYTVWQTPVAAGGLEATIDDATAGLARLTNEEERA
jgi:hypothetical protein